LTVDISNKELGVRQSPAGKNVSTEAEDIVEIRHQVTTGEDIAN
jgi:pyrimidine operon attenuation protein/uracil phosphoribosyltransferase